jgi:hypothetical protein
MTAIGTFLPFRPDLSNVSSYQKPTLSTAPTGDRRGPVRNWPTLGNGRQIVAARSRLIASAIDVLKTSEGKSANLILGGAGE